MAEELNRGTILQWELVWSPPDPAMAPNGTTVSMGTLGIRLDGQELWKADEFQWSWIELLEWLAESWVWLRGEDGLPFDVNPRSLPDLKSWLDLTYRDAPPAAKDRAERTLWEFLRTHDLSRALAGAWSDPIVIWREGLVGHVLTDNSHYTTTWESLLSKLIGIGDRIRDRLEPIHTRDERSKMALDAWAARDRVPLSRWLSIARSGNDPTSTSPLPTRWRDRLSEGVERSELLAAARMTSRLNAALAASILDRVMELPARNSAIDVVADQVISEVELDDTAAPFEQAYQYAHAFRDQAVPTSAVRFDPESWLVATGVLVEDIRLGSRDVDAIAVWGPRHGPAILVNLDGRSSQFSSGRNTSLAHEIGHLLMDRAAALPVAEVLGGKVNPRVEQRARAFAAEVLLPRESAGEGFAGVASADDASRLVASLAARYRVSHEVVAWQVRNSDVPLHPPVFEYLRSLVTYPERF